MERTKHHLKEVVISGTNKGKCVVVSSAVLVDDGGRVVEGGSLEDVLVAIRDKDYDVEGVTVKWSNCRGVACSEISLDFYRDMSGDDKANHFLSSISMWGNEHGQLAPNTIYAKLREADESVSISATLDYVLASVYERGYTVKGITTEGDDKGWQATLDLYK